MSRARTAASGLAIALAIAFVPMALPATAGLLPATTEPDPTAPSTSPAAPAPADVTCPGVDLAPVLRDDRDPRGATITSTPDANGRWHPVVLIHGFTGSSAHSDDRSGAFSPLIDLYAGAGQMQFPDRSLVGQLQWVPGAAVYTFDYHGVAARWVTDGRIGPALAEAIECLTDAYGERAVVVGHSMGGLATRQALAEDDDAGEPLADRVAAVVTFGTPNLGSDVAAALAVLGQDVGDGALI